MDFWLAFGSLEKYTVSLKLINNKQETFFKINRIRFLTILNQKKEILKKLTHSNFNLF